MFVCFFFSSRRRHTRCALVTGVQTCAIPISLDALVLAAAKLPRIAIEAPAGASVIGRTTEDQMHIGVFWGYVAMMEGLVAKLRAEIGRPTRTIATGGLAVLDRKSTRLNSSH